MVVMTRGGGGGRSSRGEAEGEADAADPRRRLSGTPVGRRGTVGSTTNERAATRGAAALAAKRGPSSGSTRAARSRGVASPTRSPDVDRAREGQPGSQPAKKPASGRASLNTPSP